MQRFEFQAEERDRKKRLDAFLIEKFENISKMYLRDIIKTEKCEVNGEWQNRGYLLRPNDFVEIELDYTGTNVIEPEAIDLRIVFEDDSIIVIDKPAGMLVHPTVGVRSGTLLNALVHHLNRNAEADSSGNPPRPGLIHRLDKQTSGLIVASKTARAHRVLAEHFRRKLVEKKYIALVAGQPREVSGVIEGPIGRYEERRVWDIKHDGKPSESRFEVLEVSGNQTLLELEPVTGRTNQLRIHLASIGHPIVGDDRYGGPEFRRLCLHAYRLAFRHPNGGERISFETPTQGVFDQ